MWTRHGMSLMHGLGLLALVLFTVSPIAARALNLNFLRNSPISYFRQEDVDLMMKNAREVLEADSNARQEWSNPRTGASGFAQVTGQFTTAAGAHCKRLRVFNRARHVEGEVTYPVCRSGGGDWVINANAQPAKQ